MKKRGVTFLLILMGFTVNLFAGERSFIRIVDPEEEEYYAYVYNIYNQSNLLETQYTFKGEVSPDCVSIRVIWSSKNSENIDEYLYNGSKPIAGVDIEDYILTKYKPGDTKFVYNASGKWENLKFGSNYYRFIATFRDGRKKAASLTFFVHEGGAAERAKPVIYLYPKEKQTVRVSVAPQGGVTVSIPEMGKGWEVIASPDGTLYDKKTAKEYPYLFWESLDNGSAVDVSEGFVIKSGQLPAFFEEKLTILGLNKKEIDDFVEFWIPEITKSGRPYVFVRFHTQEMIDAMAPLTVDPKPDSIIRVYFDHKLLDKPITVKEQQLQSAKRKGFAVIEWGGRRYR